MNSYRFAPLVTKSLGVHCALNVLFLRNLPPGEIVHRGDIDNRIKTLLDGLKMPTDAKQLGGYEAPDDGEDPFFCLLEDDSLITRLAVEADTLLEPIEGDQPNVTDARVVITVTLKPYVGTYQNQAFA